MAKRKRKEDKFYNFDANKGMYFNIFNMYGDVLKEINSINKELSKSESIKMSTLTLGQLKDYKTMEHRLDYLNVLKEKCEGILYETYNGTSNNLIVGVNYSTMLH